MAVISVRPQCAMTGRGGALQTEGERRPFPPQVKSVTKTVIYHTTSSAHSRRVLHSAAAAGRSLLGSKPAPPQATTLYNGAFPPLRSQSSSYTLRSPFWLYNR